MAAGRLQTLKMPPPQVAPGGSIPTKLPSPPRRKPCIARPESAYHPRTAPLALIANAWVQTKNAGWQADPGTSKLMIWPAEPLASARAQDIADTTSTNEDRSVLYFFMISLPLEKNAALGGRPRCARRTSRSVSRKVRFRPTSYLEQAPES